MEYPEQLDQLALQDLLAQVSPAQQDLQAPMEHQVRKDLQVQQAQQAQVSPAQQEIMVLMDYRELLDLPELELLVRQVLA